MGQYKPSYRITQHFLRLASKAAELKTRIEQAVVVLPWLPKLQADAATRLAHSSTSIEGNPLTLAQVGAIAQGKPIAAKWFDRAEVSNYLAALRWISHKTASPRISETDLLRLHRIITQKILPNNKAGKYKTKDNRVIGSDGITVYTPPPAQHAQKFTKELLAWVNAPVNKQDHPIIVSAIAHHRLVSIHPFSDGNGRMARAFALWLLYARGFDTHHVLALDEYYENDRQTYYDKIQQARDLDDDLTYWLEYVCQGIVETLTKTQERILALKITSQNKKIRLNQRQEEILRLLRDNSELKSTDMGRRMRLTRARMHQLLMPLVKAGIVQRTGETRATRYRLG